MSRTKNQSFTSAGTFACSFTISSNNSVMKMKFETDNPYDSNAVVLLLDDKKVGYVPKNINKSINPSTSVIKQWTAKVCRGKIEFIIDTSSLPVKEKKDKKDDEALLVAVEE